ncbi:MAG: right-handed parallel beta-helix repeat-containing protein [Candidatus Caldarchaeum sp.]
MRVVKLLGIGAALVALALAAGNVGQVSMAQQSYRNVSCPPTQPYTFCTLDDRGPVAFSPDGLLLATGSALWDVINGRIVRYHGRRGCISLAFSPDGSLLGCTDGARIFWWNVTTGKEVFIYDGSIVAFRQVAFSPDGRWFAASYSSKDNYVRLWDVSAKQEVRSFPARSGLNITSIAFSPNSSMLAVSAEQCCYKKGEIKLWNVHNGSLIREFEDNRYFMEYPNSVAFSPDGQLLIASTQITLIVVWDVATGDVRQYIDLPNAGNPSQGRGTRIVKFVLSPDGNLIAASTCTDTTQYSCKLEGILGAITFLDMNGNLVRTLQIPYPYVYPDYLDFSPDGSLIASDSYPHNNIMLWYVGDLTGAGGPPTQVITVCPSGCNYQSIQKAIDNAPENSLIQINRGIYSEGLSINKSLTLKGAGASQTVLDGYLASRANGIRVTGDAKVRLEGITVRRFDSSGLYADQDASVMVKDCEFLRNAGGVTADDSAQITLIGSAMNDNWSAPGIEASDSSKIIVSNSQIIGNGNVGIVAAISALLTINNSVVSNNRQSGIIVGHSARAWILNNEIYNNSDWGIYAESPYNIVECRGNSVAGNGRGNYNSAAGERCR